MWRKHLNSSYCTVTLLCWGFAIANLTSRGYFGGKYDGMDQMSCPEGLLLKTGGKRRKRNMICRIEDNVIKVVISAKKQDRSGPLICLSALFFFFIFYFSRIKIAVSASLTWFDVVLCRSTSLSNKVYRPSTSSTINNHCSNPLVPLLRLAVVCSVFVLI